MGNWEEAALALACLACRARFGHGVKIANLKCNARMISQPVSS